MDVNQQLAYILGTLKFATSAIVNLIYWLIHIYKLKKALSSRKEIISRTKTIADARLEMSKFIWTKDKPFDWFPWPITIIARELHDDCDGAALYGKWLFKLLGMKSNIYRLSGKNTNHAICVTKDEEYMVTNDILIHVKAFMKNYSFDTLEEFILEWFRNKYTTITKMW